ncbi:DUF2156 domain-containing protein [Heliophilum fasciatum]|uniref:Phosphatidylglycerol lysyltransferase C-terminal domain-containing protein n=1 Tax=Heliophilum fasciatum TaxID=35700 RepID=A0A4R2S1I0_9FIRM|nr:phosphatidylglycerol lysyltransferase domain-containing protein [Heliophilum fasciatum]MCW2277514.1 hypothetical protein [Heliophilum fasciatum]TCP65195.1 hypothetical protein EDD73_10679 [Heliophilum fasciatum]
MFRSYLRQRRDEGSECNFTTLYIWRRAFQTAWMILGDHLVVQAGRGERYFLPPFGPDDERLDEVIQQLQAFCRVQGMTWVMRGTPDWLVCRLATRFPGKYRFRADRASYDYVYRAQDLIELGGRKYQAKRNHLHKFEKEYPNHRYVPLTEEWIGACLDNEREWCSQRGCDQDENLRLEKEAITDALDHFLELGVTGGVLIIRDKVEAFTFGEALHADTALIHVEKANPNIAGCYPFINREFCRQAWSTMTYINREEDLGLEGLRKAKLSYRPVKFVKKYTVTLA